MSCVVTGLIVGFVAGFILSVGASNILDRSRISAGYFAFDGKAYRVQPITNPDSSLTPP